MPPGESRRTGVPTRFRAVDASMDLLKVLRETALDPEYRDRGASSTGRSSRHIGRWALAVLLVAGVLLGASGAQTLRTEPEAQRERNLLIGQLRTAQQTDSALRTRLAALQEEERKLSSAKIGESSVQELDETGARAGAVPVTGPGVVVTVDDAEELSGPRSPQQLVTDTDLRRLVNGLWQAGAEAIAINGHRLTTRTAIRTAGSAITVDYVSLVPPYRVEAIGDRHRLPAALNETPGGRWWNYLKSNLGLRYEVAQASDLRLPADPGLRLDQAKPPR